MKTISIPKLSTAAKPFKPLKSLQTGQKMPGFKYPKVAKIPGMTRSSQVDHLIGQRTSGLASIKVPKFKKHAKSKHKSWVAGAIKHPGALHRELGVKAGHKIPAKRLNAAAKKGGKVGARARLAKTLKGFHHKHYKHGSHS